MTRSSRSERAGRRPDTTGSRPAPPDPDGCSSPTAARSPPGSAARPTGSGIATIVPPTDGPDAVDLLDIAAVVAAARAAGADAAPSRLRVPRRERRLRRGRRSRPASAGSGRRRPRSGRWATRPPRAGWPRRSACRSCPATTTPDQSDAALAAAAARSGCPLLVKPAAGGGGKGMRIVRDRDRARRTHSRPRGARRRALRRRPADPRAARRGSAPRRGPGAVRRARRTASTSASATARSSAATRRCSRRRRRRPSTPAIRARLGDAALTLAGAVGYVSAGTCEFLLDDRGAFYFLEMNTRLQVEHPVTELVTGRDLVARPARGSPAGEPLGVRAAATSTLERPRGRGPPLRRGRRGTASCRRPAGSSALRWPAGDGIRVDAGIADGDEVGGRFDPMLAKIIAHGADRAEALDRLTAALDDTVVLGLTTNLRFLRWLVRAAGRPRRPGADRHARPDLAAGRLGRPRRAIPEAPALRPRRAARPPLAVRRPVAGGWRLNAPPTRPARRRRRGRESTGVDAPTGGPTAPSASSSAATSSTSTSPAAASPFRLAPPPDVDARRAGRGAPTAARARRARRADARLGPRRPRSRSATRSRPASPSSRSRR